MLSNANTASVGQARAALCARLQVRRAEIEEAVLARVQSVADFSDVVDPEYLEGLRAAVSAALDYGLAAVERGEKDSLPVPGALLVQARLAKRNEISLDTVLRRCFAGYTVLGDFIMQEADRDDLIGIKAIHRIGRDQAAIFDRLIGAVTEEYARAAEDRRDSTQQRRAERVKRLLAGHLLDTSEFAYDFDAWHLGVVCVGPATVETIRSLGTEFDRRLLFVREGDGVVWAWLGGRSPLAPEDALAFAAGSLAPGDTMAIGDPAHGLAGWRLTHRQALAALPIAVRGLENAVHYADVALLASMLQNDLLATSLHKFYLVPLSEERDGGVVLRETLRAYFASERNVSSAAAALGVSRNTVASRLRAIETRIGRSLRTCSAEFEAALRLGELKAPAS